VGTSAGPVTRASVRMTGPSTLVSRTPDWVYA